MKKLTLLTLSIFTTIILAFSSVAFAAETISAKVGEKITVSLPVATEEAVAAGQYTITYNTEYLKYVPETATQDPHSEVVNETGTEGTVTALFTGSKTTDVKTITAQFETLKKGETTVKLIPTKFLKFDSSKIKGVPEQTSLIKIGLEVKKYTVTFKDYDGKELKKVTVEEGKGAEAPANPTREGYEFIGWDKAYTNVTGDLVVTAKYKKLAEGQTSNNPSPSKENEPSEEVTPTGEVTSTKTSDEKEFDQTGASIAAVIAVALVAVIGSAIVTKRK